MEEIDLAAHRPNWLIGRSGRTRKTKKNLPDTVTNKSVELEKVREEIATEMEDKMNRKLRKILEKLGEMNPTLNVNIEDMCADSSGDDDMHEDDDVDGAEAT